MVFYYTSSNIKTLRNVWLDYEDAKETSPYEYMKTYIEKCPASVEDRRLTWIAETFLGNQKHFQFLREIATHLSEELTEEDQDYFMIVLYAITFQLEPKDMDLLYKSLFNISKPLLNTFTGFLSNNEMLAYISQVAQAYYDANYVTDKIIAPLFMWQPYISEMAHNYAEYTKKIENRKIKPLTIPIQMKVLNRKSKEPAKVTSQPSLPITPPNSIHNKNRKMLTKSVIDRRLKAIHQKNKQNAETLLSTIKNDKDFHYARQKDDGYYKKLSYVETSLQQPFQKPKKIVSKSSIEVRENKATLQRINKRVQMTEQEELYWIQNLMTSCRNPRFEEIMEYERQEREKDRLYDIEKKHLMGQISHEEAILAKKKVEEHNKKRYEEFLKEKEKWEEAINTWKQNELQKSRTRFVNVSLIELNILEAKNAILEKKKERADRMKKDSEKRMAEVLRVKQEELDAKIKIVKQIKILSMIAKKSQVPKIIDLTESSGVGLLCEMSIAELQERLVAIKIGIKEELNIRKAKIKEINESAKREMEETKNTIKEFIKERSEMREQAKTVQKPPVVLESKSSKIIENLKKTLEEKRKLRIKLES